MEKYHRGYNPLPVQLGAGRGRPLAALAAAGGALAVLLLPLGVGAVGPVVTQATCRLSWDAPTTNTDGTPLTDLGKYRVYIGTAPGVKKGPAPTAEVGAPNPAPTPGTTGTWACVGLTPGQKYGVVTAVDTSGLESQESNEVPFEYADISNAPANLRMGP